MAGLSFRGSAPVPRAEAPYSQSYTGMRLSGIAFPLWTAPHSEVRTIQF